jgi:uncharacterized repeat protein (TIGR02543 family)
MNYSKRYLLTIILAIILILTSAIYAFWFNGINAPSDEALPDHSVDTYVPRPPLSVIFNYGFIDVSTGSEYQTIFERLWFESVPNHQPSAAVLLTQQNYTFKGWYYDLNFTDPMQTTIMPHHSLVVHARWQANIIIVFNADWTATWNPEQSIRNFNLILPQEQIHSGYVWAALRTQLGHLIDFGAFSFLNVWHQSGAGPVSIGSTAAIYNTGTTFLGSNVLRIHIIGHPFPL